MKLNGPSGNFVGTDVFGVFAKLIIDVDGHKIKIALPCIERWAGFTESKTTACGFKLRVLGSFFVCVKGCLGVLFVDFFCVFA